MKPTLWSLICPTMLINLILTFYALYDTNHLCNAIGTKQQNNFIILWHGQHYFGRPAKLAISNGSWRQAHQPCLVPFTCYCPFVYHVVDEPVLLFHKLLCLSCARLCARWRVPYTSHWSFPQLSATPKEAPAKLPTLYNIYSQHSNMLSYICHKSHDELLHLPAPSLVADNLRHFYMPTVICGSPNRVFVCIDLDPRTCAPKLVPVAVQILVCIIYV